jgi:glycosyltransferase involved in cell wall biosynthesis
MTPPRLTVVVPTLNCRNSLERLLRSLASQTQPPDRTVVVDGGSIDGTSAIGLAYDCAVLHDSGEGDRRSHARNLGSTLAGTGFVLFLDSDMEADPRLLEECRLLIGRGARTLTIPEKTRGRGVLGAIRAWERELTSKERLLCFPRMIEVDLFAGIGGFDESISGFEDLDISATLAEKGILSVETRSAVIHHEEDVTFAKYLRKRMRYAEGIGTYRQKHPLIAHQVFSPLSRLKLYVGGIRSVADLPIFVLALSIRAIDFFSLR